MDNTFHAFIMATTTSTGSDHQMESVLMTGGFVVLGAIVSALATYFTMRLQMKYASKSATEQRVFDAQRVSYVEAMAFFNEVMIKRTAGKPVFSDIESTFKVNAVMAAISLLSSEAVMSKCYELTGLFKAPPTNKSLSIELGKMRELASLMKKDLSIK